MSSSSRAAITALLLFCFIAATRAQTFCGVVADSLSLAPLPRASVMLTDDRGKALAFAQTNEKGTFAISLPSGQHASRIVASMIGYARKTIPLATFANGQVLALAQAETKLKEVAVTSKRLRAANDTLVYSVAGFRQQQDRSIADVIAKMPGLNVAADGTIEYQGRPISKFYVEGMDLLGGQYSLASENLSADKVSSVEVLRNHQSKKVLRNSQLTDQAALNIVLTDDTRSQWAGVVEAAAGAPLQPTTTDKVLSEARLQAMMFGSEKQSLSIYKEGNTGHDLSHELKEKQDAVANRMAGESSWLSSISTAVPMIEKQRYAQNNTHLVSSNWLFRTGSDSQLRLQADYLFDKSVGEVFRQTTYNELATSPAIAESTHASSYRREAALKAQFEINRKKSYLRNDFKAAADFNSSYATTMLNGTAVRQYVKPRRRYIADDAEFVTLLSHGRNVSIGASASYTFLPGLLWLNDNRWQQLDVSSSQASVSTSFRHRLMGFYVSYMAGVDYQRQHVSTDYLSRDAAAGAIGPMRPTSQTAAASTTDCHLSPTASYQHDGWQLLVSLPLRIVFRTQGQQTATNVVLTPYATASCQMSGTTRLTASYIRSWSASPLRETTPLPFYTSYISRTETLGRLHDGWLQRMSFRMDYTNVPKGVFANGSVVYTTMSNQALAASRLDGNIYVRSLQPLDADNRILSLRGGVSKSLAAAKLVVGADVQATWNKFWLVVDDRPVACRQSITEAKIKCSLRPVRNVSVEGNSRVLISRFKCFNSQTVSAGNNAQEEEQDVVKPQTFVYYWHELGTYWMHGRWLLKWASHIGHSPEYGIPTVYIADCSVACRVHRYEIGVECTNLFGCKSYAQQQISRTTTVFSSSTLRPREILVRCSLNL